MPSIPHSIDFRRWLHYALLCHYAKVKLYSLLNHEYCRKCSFCFVTTLQQSIMFQVFAGSDAKDEGALEQGTLCPLISSSSSSTNIFIIKVFKCNFYHYVYIAQCVLLGPKYTMKKTFFALRCLSF